MAAAKQGSYNILIRATDQTAGAFKSVNDRIAKFQAPFKRLERQFQRFGQLSGLTAVAKGISNIGKAALNAVISVAKLGLGILGIAGVTSLAGIMSLTHRWSEWGNQLKLSSLWLGVTTEKMQSMRNLSELAGAGSDSISKVTENLQDMQERARLGLDPHAFELFTRMKIDMHDSDKAFKQIIDRGRQLFKEGRPADARRFLGEFNIGPDMMKYVQASDEVREAMEKEAAANAKKTEAAAQAADKFNTAERSIMQSLQATLYQALTPYAEKMASWLSDTANQQWIITKFQEGITWTKEAIINAIPYIEQMWQGAKKLFEWFQWGVDKVGGLGNALEILIGIKVAGWALGFISALAPVVRLVGTLAGSLMSIPGLLAAAGGVGAHAALKAVDPNDKMGAWVDKNIPGASFVDNAFSHVGLGRSYEEQSRVQGELDRMGQQQQQQPQQPQQQRPQQPFQSNASMFANQSSAMQVLMKEGLTEAQAEGMIGNLTQESSMREGAQNAGHYGLGQWDATRQGHFAKMFGHDIRESTRDEQLKFAVSELKTGSESKRAGRFLAATTKEEATKAYDEDIERPGNYGTENARRLSITADFDKKWKQQQASTLDVTINHNNPPVGTTTTAKAAGPAVPNPPRISSTMPAMATA